MPSYLFKEEEVWIEKNFFVYKKRELSITFQRIGSGTPDISIQAKDIIRGKEYLFC